MTASIRLGPVRALDRADDGLPWHGTAHWDGDELTEPTLRLAIDPGEDRDARDRLGVELGKVGA